MGTLENISMARKSRTIQKARNDMSSKIYRRLEEYLSKNSISNKAFAEKCDITAAGMAKIRKGESMPTKYVIDNMLKVTGMKYEEMFEEVSEKN